MSRTYFFDGIFELISDIDLNIYLLKIKFKHAISVTMGYLFSLSVLISQ